MARVNTSAKSTRVLVRASLALFLAACVVPACSGGGSAGDSDPAGVYGTYEVSGDVADVGDIETITFVDSVNYTAGLTSGAEDVYPSQGTYVLDSSAGTLTLTDSDTGESQTLPFVAGAVAPGAAVTLSSSDAPRLLGGGLTGPSQTLSSGTGQPLTIHPVCSFSSGQRSFKSTAQNCNGASLTGSSDGGTVLAQNGDCQNAVFAPYVGGSSGTPFATIKMVKSASTTAAYAAHISGTPAVAPVCFIDMNNVVDGLTGANLGKSVKVSEHFTLAQLTQTGSNPDEFVVLDNPSVRALEAFVKSYGNVSVISGFRGPLHQTSTCESQCGAISCCGSSPQSGRCQVTCARTSRHLFGKAFDLGAQYLKAPYINGACAAGFTFVYNESNHLHIDTSLTPGTCLKQGL